MAFKFIVLDPKHFDNVDNVNNLEIFADMYSDIKLSQNERVQKFISFAKTYTEIMSSNILTNLIVEKRRSKNLIKIMIPNDIYFIYQNLSTFS